jgi:glycosyltransferase involved in cell wall biosynthesis
MDKIFISFIIPVLNCEKYIEEAVFSIVNLGIENYEIIVVDNSSSDRTVDILKKMNFHNLQILQQPKKGVSAARNLAINAAKGEYIAFMDADDSYIKKTFKNT